MEKDSNITENYKYIYTLVLTINQIIFRNIAIETSIISILI